MNIKIILLLVLLIVVVILPIVFSSKSSKALEDSKSSKSLKSDKSNKIPKSTKNKNTNKPTKKPSKKSTKKPSKKLKPTSKRKPSKCECKPKPKPKPKHNQRIFRGEADENAPYQVLIEIRFNSKSDTPYKKYGGVLVSKKHIITAAHIFMPYREGIFNWPDKHVEGMVHAGLFDKTHIGQATIQSKPINRRHIKICRSK